MNNNILNPALQNIQELEGNWKMQLSNASFLPDATTVIEGVASFEWFDGGDFLVLRQGTKAEAPWATWLIGRDKDADNYTILYIDDKHSSRVYEMSFKDGVWKIWRDAVGFSQRFEGKLSEDKNMISGAWEKSQDGKKWEHDFDLVYKRIV
ncbi:MAG: hypothetical protein JSS96_00475 [Bacteroidetes bacterium]|nr:hypothetical protein [Bacteroidota bacterium]